MSPATRAAPPFVELPGELYQALYDLAEDRGLVYPGASGDRHPVRVLASEILSAYVEAQRPTLDEIADRKLEAENAAIAAASERAIEGQRIGRALTGMPPLPEPEKP